MISSADHEVVSTGVITPEIVIIGMHLLLSKAYDNKVSEMNIAVKPDDDSICPPFYLLWFVKYDKILFVVNSVVLCG
ncbi:hypothetical protein D3C76_1384030 [compost metagenome]